MAWNNLRKYSPYQIRSKHSLTMIVGLTPVCLLMIWGIFAAASLVTSISPISGRSIRSRNINSSWKSSIFGVTTMKFVPKSSSACPMPPERKTAAAKCWVGERAKTDQGGSPHKCLRRLRWRSAAALQCTQFVRWRIRCSPQLESRKEWGLQEREFGCYCGWSASSKSP